MDANRMRRAIRVRRARIRRGVNRFLWQAHCWIYRRSRGRLGGRLVGMPVLLLTTVGRRSGRPRTVALTYLPDGRNFVVIASNGGAPRDPNWYANLKASPRAWVEIKGRTLGVDVRQPSGDERHRLWSRAVQAYRGYATYQQRTRRRIPVVVLEPDGPSPPRIPAADSSTRSSSSGTGSGGLS